MTTVPDCLPAQMPTDHFIPETVTRHAGWAVPVLLRDRLHRALDCPEGDTLVVMLRVAGLLMGRCAGANLILGLMGQPTTARASIQVKGRSEPVVLAFLLQPGLMVIDIDDEGGQP